MFARMASRPLIAGFSAALVLLMGLLLAGALSVTAGELHPGPAVRTPNPELQIPFHGVSLGTRLTIDGQEVPIRQHWLPGRVTATARLAEGTYRVVLELGSALPFASVRREYTLTVDLTPPQVDWQTPPETVLAGSEAVLKGNTEKGGVVEFWGQQYPADARGDFAVPVQLKPGWNELRGRVVDPAGNSTPFSRNFFSDREAPVVRWLEPRDGDVVKSDAPELRFETEDDGEIVSTAVFLDDKKLKNGKTQDLPEGARIAAVEVKDAAGRQTRREIRFIVDSTEELGGKTVTEGALGKDVRVLQQRLVTVKQLQPEDVNGIFDATTVQAVKQFEKKLGLDPTGRADREVLVALGPRIFINQSRFSLVLDRPGKPQRRYSIACGSPRYPTPAGEFVVMEKVVDPTWIPPKSDWARGQEPIPPGPGNPLGTRWIGLDWGGVGIHGTSSPWSIGSRASHGCVRMHIEDVEDLFEEVEVGTPVTILWGDEANPAIKRYWSR